jgi:hypothetical protein
VNLLYISFGYTSTSLSDLRYSVEYGILRRKGLDYAYTRMNIGYLHTEPR